MAIYDPKKDFDHPRSLKYYNQLIKGERPFEIKVIPKLSKSQWGYFNALIVYFAYEYGCNKDHARDVIKDGLNMKSVDDKGIFHYESFANYRESDKLSILVDKVRFWSSDEAGIILPDPDEAEKMIAELKYYEEIINKY